MKTQKTSFYKNIYNLDDPCKPDIKKVANELRRTHFKLGNNPSNNLSQYKHDYPEYEHSTLEELKKWDLIEIDDNGLISLKNLNRIFILRDLYRNQFSNFNRFDEELKAEILEMEKLGLIEFENTLLSKEEAAYIN
jgi:hypothetical protein